MYSTINNKQMDRLLQCNETSSKSEIKFKEIVMELWNIPFESGIRPDFLKYKTGNNLELDMYNDKYKLAIEYNGPQHYKFPNDYHKNKEEYKSQIERDIFKIKKCEENNVYLILIKACNTLDEMYQFECEMNKFILSKNNTDIVNNLLLIKSSYITNSILQLVEINKKLDYMYSVELIDNDNNILFKLSNEYEIKYKICDEFCLLFDKKNKTIIDIDRHSSRRLTMHLSEQTTQEIDLFVLCDNINLVEVIKNAKQTKKLQLYSNKSVNEYKKICKNVSLDDLKKWYYEDTGKIFC
jgi:hypothetical protein